MFTVNEQPTGWNVFMVICDLQRQIMYTTIGAGYKVLCEHTPTYRLFQLLCTYLPLKIIHYDFTIVPSIREVGVA
jgi:hypothetical protein